MLDEATAAADAFGAAIRARDVDRLAAVYADDLVIWQNPTGKGVGKGENLTAIARVFAIVSQLEYRDIRRYPIEGGLVQQHKVAITFEGGEVMPPLDVCMIIHVRDGLIARIEEYFDSSCFAPVLARLSDGHGDAG